MRQTSLIGLEQPPDQVVKGVLTTYDTAFRIIGISVGPVAGQGQKVTVVA